MSSVLLPVFHVALFFSSFLTTSASVIDKTASGNFLDAKASKLRQLQDKQNTPDYTDCSKSHWCQAYLYGAPTKVGMGGINALEAHKITNNTGEDARGFLHENEGNWHRHWDLPVPAMENAGTPWEHATRTAGVIWGIPDGFGVTGIAAKSRAASVGHSWGLEARLTPYLQPGDVVVHNRQWHLLHDNGEMRCLFPIVYKNLATRDLVRYLTHTKGVHTVASAGNGGCDLDAPDLGGIYTLKSNDTGAILAGSFHPKSGQRITYSTYGSVINVSAWGWHVTTTNFDTEYSHTYGGTSSATPIIGGCVLFLQSAARARGLGNIPPLIMREVLVQTGHKLSSEKERHVIGPQPDLVRALGALDPSLGPPRRRQKSVFLEQ